MTFTRKKILLICLLFFTGSVLLWSALLYSWLVNDIHISLDHRVVKIEKGNTLRGLANSLERENILAWPSVWVRYAQLTSQTGIKAGEYQLPEYISPINLLTLLNSGNVIHYKIALIEGLNFKEQLARIHSEGRIVKSLHDLNDQEIIQKLNIEIDNLEGWFFPDTYSWIAGDTDAVILLQAYKKMRKVLNEEWQDRAPNLPYKNAYEALIMASIVEKETGAAYERDLIAGVFVRRLQLNMRLGTDPSVIYGMGDKYRGNITRKDLKTATPYNTYIIKGLPPTPIASPGREAIYAALHPAEGSALYFVARGDGTHEFSDTLEQHNEAVKRFQLKRKSDYRSSPN